MHGFDVESLIQIQCTIMYGPDSCSQRCRALNKLHRNFLVSMLLAGGRDISPHPRGLDPARAEPPAADRLPRPAAPSSASSPLSRLPGVGSASSLAFGLKTRMARRRHDRREEIVLGVDFPARRFLTFPGKPGLAAEQLGGVPGVWAPERGGDSRPGSPISRS